VQIGGLCLRLLRGLGADRGFMLKVALRVMCNQTCVQVVYQAALSIRCNVNCAYVKVL
jgi:hypothetical protein